MYILKDEQGNYLKSSDGYLRPVSRDKATRYTLENANQYCRIAKLQGRSFSIEKA